MLSDLGTKRLIGTIFWTKIGRYYVPERLALSDRDIVGCDKLFELMTTKRGVDYPMSFFEKFTWDDKELIAQVLYDSIKTRTKGAQWLKGGAWEQYWLNYAVML